MSWSIAGATMTGHRAESTTAASIESQKPCARLAIVCAVAGAITTASAHRPNSTCLVHVSAPAAGKTSTSASRPVSVDIVSAGIKRVADAVITTCTSAPARPSARASSAAL